MRTTLTDQEIKRNRIIVKYALIRTLNLLNKAKELISKFYDINSKVKVSIEDPSTLIDGLPYLHGCTMELSRYALCRIDLGGYKSEVEGICAAFYVMNRDYVDKLRLNIVETNLSEIPGYVTFRSLGFDFSIIIKSKDIQNSLNLDGDKLIEKVEELGGDARQVFYWNYITKPIDDQAKYNIQNKDLNVEESVKNLTPRIEFVKYMIEQLTDKD